MNGASFVVSDRPTIRFSSVRPLCDGPEVMGVVMVVFGGKLSIVRDDDAALRVGSVMTGRIVILLDRYTKVAVSKALGQHRTVVSRSFPLADDHSLFAR